MTSITITTSSTITTTILMLIHQELERAEAKHPEWPDDLVYMDQIVNEEKGEVTRAVVQYCIDGTGTIQSIRDGLKQTAAVCVRMIKQINQEENEDNRK